MNKEYNDKAIKVRNELVKGPRWDRKSEKYICQHCGGVVPVGVMMHGYDCIECGLPINER
jgi:hypothetical protein